MLRTGSLLYSTQTTLTLHPLPSPSPHSPPPSHILTSAGSAGSTVINCFDHTPSTVACATSAWGYHVSQAPPPQLYNIVTVILTLQVQLYDLTTGGHMTTLRGHAQPVTALNIHSSPANTVVTGAADRRSVWTILKSTALHTQHSILQCVFLWPGMCRVRVFDSRSGQPSATLSGHQGAVISTQCDDWKVTSGG